MNLKQNTAESWLKLAEDAKWSVSGLAKKCNVSISTLTRHFYKHMGISPKVWLTEQRQHKAKTLLNGGYSVKEAALQLGYNHPNQFSREFKSYWGFLPSNRVNSSHEIRQMT